MKFEDLNVGDKFTISVEVIYKPKGEGCYDALVKTDICDQILCVPAADLEPRNDKYKQALIDLYNAHTESSPSVTKSANVSDYRQSRIGYMVNRMTAVNRAIDLGAELVKADES